ncbi:MAG: DUF721 domain-containing protein [Thermoguttaceae bacterium]|nr:DUF721 domain-containing protein [Thermoguttaceae bacterium]MDW8038888.1 DUF721 domain-containing protein [Thermoguttaceae bacterium]
MVQNPRHVSDILTELMVRGGYFRRQWAMVLEEAWCRAVGPDLASVTRIGRLRRGVLEILVGSSPVLQELTFGKAELLSRLRQLLPDEPIHDLRFRLGRIG